MNLRISNSLQIGIASGLLGLLGAVVSAQEAAEPGPVEPARTPLLYVDMPVPLEEGIDPILPTLPNLQGPDPELDPAFDRRADTISRYSDSVEEIEIQGGAWSDGLVEELSALGRLQQQQGQHLAAIQTFDRAIHVNRINSGLYTLEQVGVVEQMIQSYMALGDWEQADIYNNYLFFVQQKAYGSNDPRLIPVLDRLASWNIQAFNVGYGDLLGIRLRQAQIMFNAAARMVGVHFGKEDERFVAYQRNIANSSFLIYRNPDLMMEIERPEYRNMQQMLVQKLNEQRSAVAPGFRTGERALLEVAQFYQEKADDSYALAEAITHLADWYLLFDRRRGALDNYKRAWDILQAEENAEELTQRLFGKVAPIPAFSSSVKTPGAFYRNEDGTEALQYDFADLEFDVTPNGQVRNVRSISEETEANAAQHSKLRIWVRSNRFRPLIVDGVPQRSEANNFRYRYWY